MNTPTLEEVKDAVIEDAVAAKDFAITNVSYAFLFFETFSTNYVKNLNDAIANQQATVDISELSRISAKAAFNNAMNNLTTTNPQEIIDALRTETNAQKAVEAGINPIRCANV